MQQQCLKCNSVVKDGAATCEACGAPFGPIPPEGSARRMLMMITVALLVVLVAVFVWMLMR